MKLAKLIGVIGFVGIALTLTCSGENLVTLDGRTYTNAVFLTNYPTVTLISHAGGKAGIKPANLPEEFKMKYGVKKEDGPLPASASITNGEFLMLIDGTTYTNAVVLENFVGIVRIGHDGGTTAILPFKFPEEFRLKHSIKEKGG